MNKSKILFYFTHKQSLGHTTRLLSIIRSIREKYHKKAEIYVFQGGIFQQYLNIPKDTSWFNLPYPYHSKANFKKHWFRNLAPLHAKTRATYMLSKIKNIRPDIFVTEFFPFGREDSRFELLPVLTYLKKRGTRIFASIGYPYIVQENIKILTFYTNFYDKFLIHTPRNLEYQYLYKNISHPELRKIYDKVFRLLEKKIIYTGYILPAAARDDKGISGYDIKGRLKIMGRPLVIVSRGGGVIYPRIIINSILVNKYLPKEVFFIIVAGPSSSKQELKLFNKLIKEAKAKNIKLYKYTPDFSALLKASDISISMAGYNTAVQLLYFKKESILIPSSVDPEIATGYCSEQLSRAELLHRYLHSVVLDYGKMSVKDMAKAIRERLLRRRPISAKIDDNWFYGDKVTADYLINNG